MMKKVLQRIATMAAVLALVVVTGISMAACGSNDNTNDSTTNICNVDNLNGFYANIEAMKVYWFDIANNTAKHAEFLISDNPNENGLYQLRVLAIFDDAVVKYYDKIEVRRGDSAVAIYHKWGDFNVRPKDLLISTYGNEYDRDLSKQFYAEDEEIIYTKISSLGEFLATVFPDKAIDTTDMTYVASGWENFVKSL